MNAQSSFEIGPADGSRGDRAARLSNRWRSHAGNVAYLVVALVSLIALVRSYLFAYRYFIEPIWLDRWFWVGDFQRWVEHRFTFDDLVKPLVGHRIVTTRPLLLLDSLMFGMHGRLLAIVNLFLLAGLGLMLGRLIRQGLSRTESGNWPLLFWVALMSAVCQYENLVIPMDVGVALVCIFTCAAAFLLTEAVDAKGGHAVALAAGAALMAIAATFSMANGVLATPALLLLLPLRRARPLIWAIFAPAALFGTVLFFVHYPSAHDMDAHWFDWHLAAVRVVYVGNYLGSSFLAFPTYAAAIGLIALLFFLAAAAALVKRYTFKGRAIPAGDAALLVLGVFVFSGGPAGSVSPRIYFGADAALVSRYATYSLLFAVVLLGLYVRRAARDRWPDWITRIGFPGVGLALLMLANLPSFDRDGDDLRRRITVSSELLRNNVAVAGPAFWYPGATIENIRDAVVFLHAHGLNIFSASVGPPASALARLAERGDLETLPACRGYVDQALAIDRTGFLLRGWIMDPTGSNSASWIAVVDGGGNLLGTATSLIDRSDVKKSLTMTKPVYGFATGFRLNAPIASNAEPSIQVLGMFPSERQPICRLPARVAIGSTMIAPLAEMGDAVSISVAPETEGPQFWHKKSGDPIKGSTTGIAAWEFSSGEQGGEKAILRFRLDTAPGSDRALAVPFVATPNLSGQKAIFTFGDGARLEIGLSSVWESRAWYVAVVPPEQMLEHRGLSTVEVHGDGAASFVVGEPISVVLRPEWSKLF